jgi:hypothetical protein
VISLLIGLISMKLDWQKRSRSIDVAFAAVIGGCRWHLQVVPFGDRMLKILIAGKIRIRTETGT